MTNRRTLLSLSLLALAALACQAATSLFRPATATPLPPPPATKLPAQPVQPGELNPDEPVFISGLIPFTSPFFLDSTAEPFVLLEDQAGFIRRDREFEFALEGQAVGPVEFLDEQTLEYSLALPAVPQGTLQDVDNNGSADEGVQVFAVAYWSNTWGGPFLERRDGVGWSNAYASTITDPERDDEVVGGILVVWAPDDLQGFPTGFGEDGLLFTADDPADSIPAGYNLVDLNQDPFLIYKEAQPKIDLVEGASAVSDFSDLSYAQAFDAMFTKVSREYPFTQEKDIDWGSLEDQFSAQVAAAQDGEDFYRAIRDFTYAIPDGHVGVTIDAGVFFEERGGSFGLVLAELSDRRVIVTQVLPGYPAAREGIEVGAQIVTWDTLPVTLAIDGVEPYFGPYSTAHVRRLAQVVFLTRVPPGALVEISYQNPAAAQPELVRLEAEVEYDSLFLSLPQLSEDELALPVMGEVLDESGLGYVRLTSFSDDYNLIARLWDRYIRDLIDNEVPGLVIDVRKNGGGSGGLASDFAGYFFDESFSLYQRLYYNADTDGFEPRQMPSRVEPGPVLYDRPLAVLIGPDCVSACEGFVYALSQADRALVVGHFPTAGAFGEVGRGQYKLPEDLSMQFPTGRPETPDGELLIEGVGVEPEMTIPVTEESALGLVDTVLEAAVEALLNQIP